MMKIGMVSDSLAAYSFAEMLQIARAAGVKGIEFNAGNWSTAPHVSLDTMISSADARADFRGQVESQGLAIVAFNANGNQLHPVHGEAHDAVIRKAIKLSGQMDLKTVVLMSGLPGANAADTAPNWITTSWPPENREAVGWQWTERLLPYWRELARFAGDHGIETLAVEMHGSQLVYSPTTLIKLRNEIGPIVKANLDPSHLMWMGADAVQSASYLGEAIGHVHGKDTFINPRVASTASLMEYGPLDNVKDRAWSHCTLGYGHSRDWWASFCYHLQMAGYEGWVSIEHEDANLGRVEGLTKAVNLLAETGIFGSADYSVQDI